ncbi:MAG TPA: HypC/HybG/HupF family hydrogenase formation chaperone [Caproiciproducens sp.]|jgi:hydrogenase assembly chaperone HypC/HupF|nr:HypC/HybG/HupF family hydrogenase formation chaperone [Caproiciproducens sp.]
MCVAMPGKVIKVDGTVAEVDFSGNVVRAEAGLVQIKPGDYVLVHAGCIIQVISEEERNNLASLFEEIESYA